MLLADVIKIWQPFSDVLFSLGDKLFNSFFLDTIGLVEYIFIELEIQIIDILVEDSTNNEW